MFKRASVVAIVFILLAQSGFAQLTWLGNTKLWMTGVGQMPNRDGLLEPWQSVSVTTQTNPIAAGQRVFAVVTHNHWQTVQEYEFSFDFNVGSNSQWYVVLTAPAGTDLEFYIRAQASNGDVRYDNNGGQDFGFVVRRAPIASSGAILQWFETDYRTMMLRLPEVVRAGYSAIYLPAPQKSGGGGLSVGYNPFDHFDLGDRIQKGSVRTKYGTTQELQELIRLAKRLGLQVYCDLVLNHADNRASSAIDRYPNMIPEDFHVRSSTNTTNTELDFNNAPSFGFGTLNHDILGLADIAHEDGNLTRTGAFNLPSYATFNAWDKPSFVRQPLVPQYYPDGAPVAEDVRQYLARWTQWLTQGIGFDGFRIDAVRHAPPGYFWRFGRQPGGAIGQAHLMPSLYAANPSIFVFGEVYTSSGYELREYAKAGMNVLDFPLKFNLDSLFNSSGFGNISQALSNGYGIDTGTGLTYQNGGVAGHLGMGFVQSHDQGPPYSNNLAYAFLLTRPGRPIVYYDGNNINPSDTGHFPRPGRFDSLGQGSDAIVRMLDARSRFARGSLVNRHTSNQLYVYERQVNGQGTLLVGLNIRGDMVDLPVTVQTAFAPGTALIDLGGRKPPVTVGTDSRVTISVPHNSTGGPTNNGHGYVLYAPQSPAARTDGTRPVQILKAKGGEVIPFTQRSLPSGAHASASSFEAATVSERKITLRVLTDGLGHSAVVKLDSGTDLAGRAMLANTPEGLSDGFVPMDRLNPGEFVLEGIDLTGLSAGLHLFRVRVYRDVGSRPAVYSDFLAWFYYDPPRKGMLIDGNLTDHSAPVYAQVRNPSSNANRLDALYVDNDEACLYIGMAGRVDVSENLTNGMALYMDLDPGSGRGIAHFGAMDDDSGPATRLLSNANLTAPAGFGAEFALSAFRHSSLHSSPEAGSVGDEALPFTVGAQAGAFRLSASNPRVLSGVPARIAFSPRPNKTDPPRGLEAAIPLSALYPYGAPLSEGRIGLVGLLLNTGETGITLAASDTRRGAYGGRIPGASWVSNQFAPTQSNIVGDPGSFNVTLQSYLTYNLRYATPVAQDCVLNVDVQRYDATRQVWTLECSLVNRSGSPISGPVRVLAEFPPGVEALNADGLSPFKHRHPFWLLKESNVAPGERIEFEMELRASDPKLIKPLMRLFSGKGLL